MEQRKNKKMKTKKFKEDYKTVTIEIETWKNLVRIKTTYEFKTMSDAIKALTKLEKQFKPELKEVKK